MRSFKIGLFQTRFKICDFRSRHGLFEYELNLPLYFSYQKSVTKATTRVSKRKLNFMKPCIRLNFMKPSIKIACIDSKFAPIICRSNVGCWKTYMLAKSIFFDWSNVGERYLWIMHVAENFHKQHWNPLFIVLMVGYIIIIENLPTFAGEQNWYAPRIQHGLAKTSFGLWIWGIFGCFFSTLKIEK